MHTFILILILTTSAWVWYDASCRDWSRSSFANRPWKWVVGSLLLWIVIFPTYLIQRRHAPEN